MDKPKIEQMALAVIDRVRKNRRVAGTHGSELSLCNPRFAAAACGYVVDFVPDLGAGVAGVLDRENLTIRIATHYKPAEQAFTLAHEIGHLMLAHPGMHLHRDRPFDRGKDRLQARPPVEAEADYFAACLTMPDYLVEEEFTRTFGPLRPHRMTDGLAYHLNRHDPEWAFNAPPADLAVALARFAHHQYVPESLADRFRVSPTSMGIRLLELGMVPRSPRRGGH